jgi:lysozyme
MRPYYTADPTPRSAGFMRLAAVIGAPAALLLFTSIPADEGVVYRGYRDPVGIPTKCMGDTRDVVVGRRYSVAECELSMSDALINHSKPVLACVPGLRGRTNQLAASISWAYNVGTGAFCRSLAAKRFNAGDFKGGCLALSKPVTARGRVLRGLVLRRQREVSLCLKGL